MFRRILFWIHLAGGCVAGMVILVVAISGILLSFRAQMIHFADRDFRSHRPSAAAAHLPVEQLLAAAARPNITAITLAADPEAPAEVTVGREHILMVDVYSGQVLGESSPGVGSFFRGVENLHRWLAASPENRAVGRSITGVSSMVFLVLVISGPILWMPRKWSWNSVRQVSLFRGGLSGRAREYNWHNVIGIWCAPTLFVMVLCGVIMSQPWANNLLYRATGNAPPVQNAERRPRAGGAAGNFAGLNRLWVRAEQQVPGWRTITLRLPNTFTIDTGDGGRPDQRSQLTLNPRSGEVIRWEPFSSENFGRRLRAWVRYVHTGEAGGIAGQSVAALSAAGAVVLVWTGVWLALRRLLRFRKSKTLNRS